MPRPRTGTFEAFTLAGRTVFRGRLRLADGTKSDRFDLPEGMTEAQARAYLAGLQAEEDASHAVLNAKKDCARELAAERKEPHERESADAWFGRYLPTKECGENHRRLTDSAWSKWISPLIGAKPMAGLTRDDVEDVRDALDRALSAKTIRHATARNVWGALTGALKAAYAAKDRTLRVHPAPLHFGVLPPKRGDGRQRPWLYPREWAQVAASAEVPIEWRQLYAVAVYTGLRPGELRALTWADVDLNARTLTVSKSYERESESIKAPKTFQGRRVVPLHDNLLPLLERLRGEPGESVAPLLSALKRGSDRVAMTFRAHLRAAGVDRARLEADNATEEPVDFRSLRDSYATWSALAGVGERVLQRRMGHAGAATTDRYIKAAESFGVDAIGEPFPALPTALLTRVWPNDWTRKSKTPGFRRGLMVARAGFETRKPRPGSMISGTSNGPQVEIPAQKGEKEGGLDQRLDQPRAPRQTVPVPIEVLLMAPAREPADVVEAAIAMALAGATAAGQWGVVAQLARELEARRVARAGAQAAGALDPGDVSDFSGIVQ